MGTFHTGKGELHGITVVVDTNDTAVFIGRCDEPDDRRIILNDVDQHDEKEGGPTKQEYISRAAKFGAWKKHDRVEVPRNRIASIRRLGEITA
jgi:hypothetical protein